MELHDDVIHEALVSYNYLGNSQKIQPQIHYRIQLYMSNNIKIQLLSN